MWLRMHVDDTITSDIILYDIITTTRYIKVLRLEQHEYLAIHIVTMIVWADSAIAPSGISSLHRRLWLTTWGRFTRWRCLFYLWCVAFRLSREVRIRSFLSRFFAHGSFWCHLVFGLDELVVTYEYSVSYLHLVTSRSYKIRAHSHTPCLLPRKSHSHTVTT